MRTGFLLAEDEALKKRLSTLTVTDDREVSRPVQVFFRYPDVETERTYPFITIEMIDIVHARNRQHSETELYYFNTSGGATAPAGWEKRPNALTYWPSESSDFSSISNKNDFKVISTNEFVPVDLVYQVSTYTRNALHDRQLSSMMLRKVFPFRRSGIHIDADNTDRRLEMLDWTTADLLDAESGYRKRIFRKIYTLQMGAELPSTDLYGYKQTTQVIANIDYTE
jgi:hypothetical protein